MLVVNCKKSLIYRISRKKKWPRNKTKI